MRAVWKTIACLLLLTPAWPALAGISVTSYRTVALSNAFAPTSQAQYYERQELINVSPALVQVSGDWMGPNAGGTTPTWHYVGSAQTMSTTEFDLNTLTISAAGSFSYEIATTADFIDPRSISILTPGAAANYEGFFTTEIPTNYTISALLNEQARVRLNTLSGSVIFNEGNPTSTPVAVNLSGTIPPGQYRLLVTSGLGAPNLPNGVNHLSRSGRYEDVIFTVRVPEPNTLGVVMAISGYGLRRRKRSAGAE